MARAAAQHTFFTVKGEHNTLYLLGSVHLLKASDRELPAAALTALGRSAALVMEVDLTDAKAAHPSEATEARALLPPGQTLAEVLGPEANAEFEAHARAAGLEPARLSGFRPWFAALTLLQLSLAAQGFDFESGVDAQLARRAVATHKPIIALETVDQQLSLFAALPDDEQRRFLLYLLKDVDDTPRTLKDVVRAWRGGDTARLEALLGEGFGEFPELYAPLVADRNRAWLGTLTRLLHERSDYLVVVGALHLVGRDGLVELLRAAGYPVVQH